MPTTNRLNSMVLPKLKIGIDLDGVVFDFINHFTEYVNREVYATIPSRCLENDDGEVCNYPILVKDIKGWSSLAKSGLMSSELENKLFLKFARGGEFIRLSGIPDARQAIARWLWEDPYPQLLELHFVTSRPSIVAEDTSQALAQIGLGSAPLIILEGSETKADVAKRIGLHILIDDKPSILQEFKDISPALKTILLNYNNTLDLGSEIEEFDLAAIDWSTIVNYIDEIALPEFMEIWAEVYGKFNPEVLPKGL